MQCIQLRRGDPPVMTVDVVLSGEFHQSHTSVKIDGTTYNSAQTVKVKKGTRVTVIASATSLKFGKNCTIALNGTIVAKGTQNGGAASYTFTVTDNCSISFTVNGAAEYMRFYSAAITMPAT